MKSFSVKRVLTMLTALLLLVNLTSCFTLMYQGVLPQGVEEEKLLSRAETIIKILADERYDDLEAYASSELAMDDLKESYGAIRKIVGEYKSCVFLYYGGNEGEDGYAFVTYNCNHLYGQVECTLVFDTSYKLTELQLKLDKASVKDPNLVPF